MAVLQRTPPTGPHSDSTAVLGIAVLGVVYGDIGTSPIYTLHESFFGKNPRASARCFWQALWAVTLEP